MFDNNKKDNKNEINLFPADEANYPNVDFDLLRDFCRLSGTDTPFKKGADYRIDPPFKRVNSSDFNQSASSFSKKNNF